MLDEEFNKCCTRVVAASAVARLLLQLHVLGWSQLTRRWLRYHPWLLVPNS
jgi:hypothetical protein